MKTPNLEVLSAIAIASVCAVAVARAGGNEVICPMNLCVPPTAACDIPVVERWNTTAATPLPWGMAIEGTAAAGTFVPGFPANTCFQPSLSDWPGMKSIVAAMKAWNSVAADVSFAVPGSGGFSPTLVQHVPGQAPQMWDVAGNDAINMITFFEPASYFTAWGGNVVIAAAAADVFVTTPTGFVNPTGFIDECDIAFQTLTTVTNPVRPVYSFLEDVPGSADLAKAFASTPPTTSLMPVSAYVDIQGVATHELGHFLGLAHSINESICDGVKDEFPTMYIYGGTALPRTSQEIAPGPVAPACTYGSSTFVNTTLPTAKGILGLNARDLEPDDVCAVFSGYAFPGPNPYPGRGSISGGIRRWDGSMPTPLEMRGATVTAIKRSDPNGYRVSTLCYHGGKFLIPALDPDSYLVSVQQADQRPNPGSYLGANSGAVPNYIFVQSTPTTFAQGCLQVGEENVELISEYYSNSEGFLEFLPQAARTVVVTAGATTQVDIDADQSAYPQLEVRLAGSNNFYSDRGLQASRNQQVEFRVRGQNNAPVELRLDLFRTLKLSNGQIEEIAQPAGFNAVPGFFMGSISGGVYSFFVTMPAGTAYTNVLAQAIYYSPTGTNPHYSQVVNVWVRN